MWKSNNAPSEQTGNRIKKVLLTRKYRQFFFPSLVAAVAVSLSEFVDSLVVSNLLDTHALSVVNVCSPLMTLMAAVYLIFAVGGVVSYMERRAKSDFQGAASVYTVCIVTALGAGGLFMAVCLLFTRTVANLLCPGLILGEVLLPYIRILSLSMPVLIPVTVVLYFLASAGNPGLSMALNIIANVLNLLLDFVYIRIFNTGVVGAAAATLTSYTVAGILYLIFKKRCSLRLTRISAGDFRCMTRIVRDSLASSVSQIGLTIKYAYANGVAASLGGDSGLAAMSLCSQAFSIISIIITGVSDTIRPFVTLLHTQHDYNGAGYILKKSLGVMALSAVAFVAVIEAFPGIITGMYNAKSPEVLSVAIPAIRIVTLCFLFRSVYLIFMDYIAILEMTAYATYVSLLDGFVGIVAIGFVLSRVFGLTGMWLTFPVDAVLVFFSIIVINIILHRKHPHRFTGPLLIEKDAPDVRVLDLAIDDDDKSAVYISEKAMAFCRQNGCPEKLATRIGLIAEEMAIYIRGHIQSHELLNMLLHKKGDTIWLYFRSIGEPYELSSFTEKDIPENFRVLKALIPDYKYNYTMGMNNLRVKFVMKK